MLGSRRPRLSCSLVLGLLVGAAVSYVAPASAAAPPTHGYVTAGGTDTGDCASAATACATLTYAYGRLADAGTIHVGAGTFAGLTVSGARDITIVGAEQGARIGTVATAAGSPTLALRDVTLVGVPGLESVSGTTTIERSTVVADASGQVDNRGVWVRGGSVTIDNSTLSGHGVNIQGDGGTAVVRNSTIADSWSYNVFRTTGGSITLSGSVVSRRASAPASLHTCFNVTDGGRNIDTNGSCSTGNASGNLALGELGYHPGTALTPTYRPAATSDVIDRIPPGVSGCPGAAGASTDQAGADRLQGGSCDSGSVEQQRLPDDVYVATPADGGSDTGNCRTAATACATLLYAYGQAAPTATVHVGPGSFAGGSFTDPARDVTFAGSTAAGAPTTITSLVRTDGTITVRDMDLPGRVLVAAGATTLDRVTVAGPLDDGASQWAVTVESGALTVRSSTLSGRAWSVGITQGTVTVRNSTLVGGYYYGFNASSSGTSVSVAGSIVAPAATGSACSHGAAFTDEGYNLIVGTSCGALGTGSRTVDLADLRLGALGDHGGPTPTYRPEPASPAIDLIPAGHALCTGPATDQTGSPRRYGTGCDAGSVERGNTAPVADDRTVTTDGSAPLTFTVTGSDAEGDALAFVLVGGPTRGSLVLNANGTAIYRAGGGATGTDSFTFRVCEKASGHACSAPATVTINIPAPKPADVYVTVDGTDTGDCATWASACATIDYAEAQGAATVTVHMGPGEFPEGASLAGAGRDITVVGSPEGTEIGYGAYVWSGTPTVTLRDLTIAAVQVCSGTTTLERVLVTNAKAWYGVRGCGGTVHVRDSTITDVTRAVVAEAGSIVYVQGSTLVDASEYLLVASGGFIFTAGSLYSRPGIAVCGSGFIVATGGYNLSSEVDGPCNFFGTSQSNVTGLDLGELGDHGGPTRTFRPGPESPAINRIPAGTDGCPADTGTLRDQTGADRLQGPTCDVGAFEQGGPVTVTFDSAGGSAIDPAEVGYGAAVDEPAAPTRAGHTFEGWYAGGTAYDFGTLLRADLTLTAHWTLTDVGTVITDQPDDVTVNAGQDATFTATATGVPDPVARWEVSTDGGDHWSTQGGEVATESGQPTTLTLPAVAAGLDGRRYRVRFSNSTGDLVISDPATLTVRGPVAVTFDAQGGSAVAGQSVEHGQPVARPADPTRSGYSFTGWYTSADGSTPYAFETLVTAPLTLYAHWAPEGDLTVDAHPVIVTADRFTVRCHATEGTLRSCSATVTARSGGRTVVLARGAAPAATGSADAVVQVRLTAEGRRLTRPALGGVAVTLLATGVLDNGLTRQAQRASLLFAPKQTRRGASAMFRPDGARLTAAGKRFLDGIARQAEQVSMLTCVGHTARTGNRVGNRIAHDLSVRRAEAACAYLVKRGVHVRTRVRVVGVGNTDTRKGGAPRNRFVDVVVRHG
ncbi:InlB B-repeat-containing protein [Pimelobacter sp. 30-1]|uniref:InlB B-repeat-containing protein n=1 Tax=Pimelobacter sp. 30-1 TaxID=2004991 RepID=UPI001C0572B9|nr:InlB B-repeat-containing protein [Pimelobacter sp. 30-1]